MTGFTNFWEDKKKKNKVLGTNPNFQTPNGHPKKPHLHRLGSCQGTHLACRPLKKKNGWAVTFWSPNARRSLNLKTGSQITIPKKVTLGFARRLVVLFKKSSLCFCPVQFITLSVELEKFVPGDMLFTPATRVVFKMDLNHPETFPQIKRVGEIPGKESSGI